MVSTKNINLTEAEFHVIKSICDIRDKNLSLKLMEMGCVFGTTIEKISSAPFRGPVIIRVYPNENLLAIRFEEAKKIILD